MRHITRSLVARTVRIKAGDIVFDIGTVTEDLSKGIRLLTVKVKWKFGADDQDVTLSRQLVSLTQAEVLTQ